LSDAHVRTATTRTSRGSIEPTNADMPPNLHTIAAVDAHFAAGCESVTLTRAEWESIQEISQGYFKNGCEVRAAAAETERIRQITRPLWRACKAVSKQLQGAMTGNRGASVTVSRTRLQDWEMRLRHATDVNWRDLPAGHRLQRENWR
jgi:hypothetical protein